MVQDGSSPEIIFMLGLPGAGKSSWVAKYLPTHRVIDPDVIMQSHPQYDPRHPSQFYRWSKQQAESMLNRAFRSEAGQWVYVGTGANIVTLLGRISLAKKHHFHVGLVYVYCSLETALARNAVRERRIPEYVICEKARFIQPNFKRASAFVDIALQVYSDDGVDFALPAHDTLMLNEPVNALVARPLLPL